MRNEFDQFADSYDKTLKAALPAGLDEDQYFARYKIDFLAAATRNRTISSILDFGCGPGRDLVAFHALGVRRAGLPVSVAEHERADEFLHRPAHAAGS